jgi:hypothetical protein
LLARVVSSPPTTNREVTMLRLLMSALNALWSALCWGLWFCGEVVMAPARAMLPGPGRSAIPSAPVRTEATVVPSRTFTPDVSPKAMGQREAAAVVTFLAKRLRQGSGCPALSTNISPSVRMWAHGLDDDQSKCAIALGFSAVADHLSGRRISSGLPVHSANIRPDDSGDVNRLRPAARLIRARNRIDENYASPLSASR